jgi:hypothetical protein
MVLHMSSRLDAFCGEGRRQISTADDIWENGLFTLVLGFYYFSLSLLSGLAYLRVRLWGVVDFFFYRNDRAGGMGLWFFDVSWDSFFQIRISGFWGAIQVAYTVRTLYLL